MRFRIGFSCLLGAVALLAAAPFGYANSSPNLAISSSGNPLHRSGTKTIPIAFRGYNTVGNSGVQPDSVYFSSGRVGAQSAKGGMYQVYEKAQCDAANIRLVFDNHYGGHAYGTGMISDNVSPINLKVHAAIVLRDPTRGKVLYPVTFSNGTVTQPTLAGGLFSSAESDPVSGLVLAKGQRFWINVYVTSNTAPIMWPLYTSANNWSGYGDICSTGVPGSLGGTDQSQSVTPTGGGSQCDGQYGMYAPALILGDASSDINSVLITGDSRIGGDINSATPAETTSYAGYDLDGMGVPFVMANQSGEGLEHLFTNGTLNARGKYRLKLIGLANPDWAIVAYGTNDFCGGNGIPAISCASEQYLMTLWCGYLHRLGIKIEVHTIAPVLSNTTSADLNVGSTLQVVNSAAWNNIRSFNNWLNGQTASQDRNISSGYSLANCYVSRVVDVESIVGDPLRNGKWRVESAPRLNLSGQAGYLSYTPNTVTIKGANLPTNVFVGMVLQVTTGAGVGYYRIAANTATTFTIAGNFAVTPTNGVDTFKVWFASTSDGAHYPWASKVYLVERIDSMYSNRFAPTPAPSE